MPSMVSLLLIHGCCSDCKDSSWLTSVLKSESLGSSKPPGPTRFNKNDMSPACGTGENARRRGENRGESQHGEEEDKRALSKGCVLSRLDTRSQHTRTTLDPPRVYAWISGSEPRSADHARHGTRREPAMRRWPRPGNRWGVGGFKCLDVRELRRPSPSCQQHLSPEVHYVTPWWIDSAILCL